MGTSEVKNADGSKKGEVRSAFKEGIKTILANITDELGRDVVSRLLPSFRKGTQWPRRGADATRVSKGMSPCPLLCAFAFASGKERVAA